MRSIGARLLGCLLLLSGFLSAPGCDDDEGTRGRAVTLTLIGQTDLGGRGENADVWSHRGFAYVGTWSGTCPGTGVKVVDVSSPSRPSLVGTLAAHPGSSTEDVMVIRVTTPSFRGDLLAVGLQTCGLDPSGQPGPAGVELWDVSDPRAPLELALLENGLGVHELFLFQRGGRAFVLEAVPFSEFETTLCSPPFFDPAFCARDYPRPLGDVRVIEVTDPRDPVEVADWGAGKDGGLPFGGSPKSPAPAKPPFDCTPPGGGPTVCRGDAPGVFAHSVSADASGNRAYVAYWDLGMVVLDLADPVRPQLLGRGVAPAGEEGDMHSAIEAPQRVGGRLLAVTTDEDFSPSPSFGVGPGNSVFAADTWGAARIFDVSDPASPVEVGRFATPNSLLGTNGDGGFYTVHNPELADGLLFLSWYSDGVRVVDLSDPTAPAEVAAFVPPAVADPSGFGFATAPLVWGVHVDGDLVFVSDINYGLYVLRLRR